MKTGFVIVLLLATAASAQQKGTWYPAGDGCNSCRCLDDKCKLSTCTLLACERIDSPSKPELPPFETQPFETQPFGKIETFTPAAPGYITFIAGNSEPLVTIHQPNAEKILITIPGADGKVTLTVYTDGSVKSDANLDELAKKFWKALAAAHLNSCETLPTIPVTAARQ